jgi:hypothetical protein
MAELKSHQECITMLQKSHQECITMFDVTEEPPRMYIIYIKYKLQGTQKEPSWNRRAIDKEMGA